MIINLSENKGGIHRLDIDSLAFKQSIEDLLLIDLREKMDRTLGITSREGTKKFPVEWIVSSFWKDSSTKILKFKFSFFMQQAMVTTLSTCS